ncbi:type II toxin-antitoxin system VapB family antitoxin [Sphingomonas sp. GB1N7]|uniref:type II toxin-antitoxin system VapB family antitoxin n=1 Tax=Parasphingomonas caseinilytica TaxID=3096158 RepID=UPI002FC7D7FC
MGISIKHEEIERLIRQLASQRQSSMVQAIGIAVRNELERSGSVPMTDEERARRMAAIRKIQDEVAAGGIDWSETDDEILGYDEFGVPEQPYLS